MQCLKKYFVLATHGVTVCSQSHIQTTPSSKGINIKISVDLLLNSEQKAYLVKKLENKSHLTLSKVAQLVGDVRNIPLTLKAISSALIPPANAGPSSSSRHYPARQQKKPSSMDPNAIGREHLAVMLGTTPDDLMKRFERLFADRQQRGMAPNIGSNTSSSSERPKKTKSVHWASDSRLVEHASMSHEGASFRENTEASTPRIKPSHNGQRVLSQDELTGTVMVNTGHLNCNMKSTYGNSQLRNAAAGRLYGFENCVVCHKPGERLSTSPVVIEAPSCIFRSVYVYQKN